MNLFDFGQAEDDWLCGEASFGDDCLSQEAESLDDSTLFASEFI